MIIFMPVSIFYRKNKLFFGKNLDFEISIRNFNINVFLFKKLFTKKKVDMFTV